MKLVPERPRRLSPARTSTSGRRSSRLTLEVLEDRCLPTAVGYTQVNLASDLPGVARVIDPNLVNPWGISFSPTGPFWFANAGSGTSNVLDGRGDRFDLVVSIPAWDEPYGGEATGTVYNPGWGFPIEKDGQVASSVFLFVTEDGMISGWHPGLDRNNAIVALDNWESGANYKGLAIAEDANEHYFIYAANFSLGRIDVFDENWQPVQTPHAFEDSTLPDGFAPFNVQAVGDLLFVTYARQDDEKYDEVAGHGNGFVNVFDVEGHLLQRFASQGVLNAPWGVAQAPDDFGPFGGALLIGNTGDGHINAFDPHTGDFLGQLANDRGVPITIPTLWGISFGNDHLAGNAHTLYFSAGIGDEEHGLFGALQAPQYRGTDTAGTGGFDPSVDDERADYPIPPMIGPASQAPQEQTRPISILLPLADSSLALAPTLSSATRVPTAPAPSTNEVVPVGFDAGSSTVISNVPVSESEIETTRTRESARVRVLGLESLLDARSTPPAAVMTTALQPARTVRTLAYADVNVASLFAGASEPATVRDESEATVAVPLAGANTDSTNANDAAGSRGPASDKKNRSATLMGLFTIVGVSLACGLLPHGQRCLAPGVLIGTQAGRRAPRRLPPA